MKGFNMKFVYLVFLYVPKHKYGDTIYEGHYEITPLVFEKYKDACKLYHSYKHAIYIKKVKLR